MYLSHIQPKSKADQSVHYGLSSYITNRPFQVRKQLLHQLNSL